MIKERKTEQARDNQSEAIGDARQEELKRMLISRQRELRNELHSRIRSVRTEGSEQNRGLNPDDISDITVQDDLQFALIELKAETAKKIDVALRRLEQGTYGLCLECGDEIAQSRLRALPFAARCKECEEAIETSQERARAQARRASSPLLATLGLVIAFAFAATAASAQTPAANTTQPSGDPGRSAAAMAQEASNPFASSWALQLQQNNNWTEMPFGDDHTRVQSNYVFQPLISLRLTEKQGLIIRPDGADRELRPAYRSERAERSDRRIRRHRSRICAAASAPRRPTHGRPQARRSSSRRHRRICSASGP